MTWPITSPAPENCSTAFSLVVEAACGELLAFASFGLALRRAPVFVTCECFLLCSGPSGSRASRDPRLCMAGVDVVFPLMFLLVA